MRIPRYHSSFLMTLIVLLIGCKGQEERATVSTDTAVVPDVSVRITKTQFEANRMAMEPISSRSLPEVISVSGRIDVPPQSVASISAIHGGYIKDIPFLEGDSVRKGQALVTLENPEFITIQQSYLETSEQLGYLRAEYERQKTLIEENITSQKNFLKAESEYKSAVARLEGLRKQLLMLSISPERVEAGTITSTSRLYAPIDGSISEVYGTKGMYVSPTKEILQIINTDHIHLELNVFEKDIMKLEKGQDIEFQVPEISEGRYGGEVYLIGTDIGANRTIKVHGHLKNESGVRFLRGMFVEAEILTGTKDMERSGILSISESAIVEIEDRHYVLQLESQDEEGYVFKKIEVEIGQVRAGYAEVRSEDLSARDQVLVRGAYEAMPQ